MIVKIQRSLATNHPNRRMLVYDKSRRIFYETDDDPEIAALMGDRPKVYFHAHLEGTSLSIDDIAEDQDW